MSEQKPNETPKPAENDVLRRMLTTPPEKHAKKAKPKKAKKADK